MPARAILTSGRAAGQLAPPGMPWGANAPCVVDGTHVLAGACACARAGAGRNRLQRRGGAPGRAHAAGGRRPAAARRALAARGGAGRPRRAPGPARAHRRRLGPPVGTACRRRHQRRVGLPLASPPTALLLTLLVSAALYGVAYVRWQPRPGLQPADALRLALPLLLAAGALFVLSFVPTGREVSPLMGLLPGRAPMAAARRRRRTRSTTSPTRCRRRCRPAARGSPSAGAWRPRPRWASRACSSWRPRPRAGCRPRGPPRPRMGRLPRRARSRAGAILPGWTGLLLPRSLHCRSARLAGSTPMAADRWLVQRSKPGELLVVDAQFAPVWRDPRRSGHLSV